MSVDILRVSSPHFDDWPTPQPLLTKAASKPYPLNALPDLLRLAVQEVLGFTKAPIPLAASSSLAALSLVIQAYVDVKRAEKLVGPVSLFTLTIADSGERKSTCDGFFMKVIIDWEAEQQTAAKSQLSKHVAVTEGLEAKRNGIKNKISQLAKAGESTSDQESELQELEQPDSPRIPRLIYTDATPEALQWSLAKIWPSGGVISSEAGLVFGGHGMGTDSVMRNLTTMNQLWDGADIATERRGSESFTVSGARWTMGLQVQEHTLRAFFGRSGGLARGTGFLARFLVAWPESTQGTRSFSEPPDSWPALGQFNQRLIMLLKQPAPINQNGGLSPEMLSLSPAAKDAWIAFHDAIEAELSTSGELYEVRDVASKIADNAVRIAALFHVFEYGTSGDIGFETFEGASRIAAWHLHEAKRFYGELALSKEQTNTIALDAWLMDCCTKERTNRIARREIQRHITPTPLRKGATLDIAFAELIELGRIRVVQQGRAKVVLVNPMLLRDKPR